MKLSKKLKQKLKRQLLSILACIAIITTTLAFSKLADFSMPKNVEDEIVTASITESSSEIKKSSITRLENTDTITYIYDADDLAAFRDAVNAGDTYAGKTVYLMNNIDMSSVCSSEVGSWIPIGGTTYSFDGKFVGNYCKIKNLYINNSNLSKVGLFSSISSKSVIEKLQMENINIINSYSSGEADVAGIVAVNYGKIENCSIISGKIYSNATSSKYRVRAAGIAGYCRANSSIIGCFNKADITGILSTGSGSPYAYVGGIAGRADETGIKIWSCYNTGRIEAKGAQSNAGGIMGYASKKSGSTISFKYLYNVGTVVGTGSNIRNGGIIGMNGYDSSYAAVSIPNCYCTNSVSYYYSTTANKTGCITSDNLKKNTVLLGNVYVYDVYNQNDGYPVLTWENERPVMCLNKNQAYIKVGEQLQLNVIEKNEITEILGSNCNASNFKWVSTKEDVASVDENGKVTGLLDGYTTVYAYHEASGMYAMSVINVAKNFATPQIGTGNGFSGILKSDGTVWTVGNGSNGQLGNGDNNNSNSPLQVKIDEDTNLDNIIKIAVGTDHMMALRNDGKIYAWGANASGSLGQNNTNNSNYAKIVLGEDGTSYLENIIDIAVGQQGSSAIDSYGNVYVWGDGIDGEMENNSFVSSYLPVKTSIKNAIKIAQGYGHVTVLTSDGVLWAWGRNNAGQLGINCINTTSYAMKVALNVTDISTGFVHTTIQKVDNNLYSVGNYEYGKLGTGSTANVTTYTKVNLPNIVSETNRVKYFKAGMSNTTLLLEDGTVWSVGYNVNGELGNGENVNRAEFVQGKTEEQNLENVFMIGQNKGNSEDNISTLNTAVILNNGDIYTTGDNTYGQFGNYSNDSSTYYTKMEGTTYLTYDDKSITLSTNEQYQIEFSKLHYIYQTFNVYNKESYTIKNINYKSLDESVAIVDNNGIVTAQDINSGITKIEVTDFENGFSTDITVIVNKLQDTDTVMYIYDSSDMLRFRNLVNDGDDFSGKSVYVMADIDMTKVCSETVGSWKSIGNYAARFNGMFDGNYHTINGIYINNTTQNCLGLFGVVSDEAIIKNILLKDVKINNSFSNGEINIGGIAGESYGKILNCGIMSGNINTNSSTSKYRIRVGGIVGYCRESSVVTDCYNCSNVTGILPTGSGEPYAYVGGIVGRADDNKIIISNCYNTGKIESKGKQSYAGGIIGFSTQKKGYKITFSNLYNVGETIATGTIACSAGIVGENGYSSSFPSTPIKNSYCINTYSYVYANKDKYKTGCITPEVLKTYASTLGNAYEDDDFNINEGYPILWWQAPKIELNKKQEYINEGEEIQLNIIKTDSITNILGDDFENTDFTWSSTNEDIATVNENGLITGLTDGYTTIYAHHEESDLYAMCIVNVAKNKANPQIESGEGFTVILKADGTVWALGLNENGQLGDGTNENKIEAVQVKIDVATNLENVVKISVGTNHTLALTKDGKVYSWGANSNGQLGQNNTESSNYAKQVLAEGGAGNLEKIIDISSGSYGSVAINQFGWIYVWGNGSYGENGNGTTNSNNVPIKTTINNGIEATMGAGHIALLSQSGKAYTWGRNTYGELGIGNTTNNITVARVAENITEVSASGYETIIKNVAENVLATGLNTSGQLGVGTNVNVKVFNQVTVPNEVKYIKAGRTSSNFLLKDGTVYTAGNNISGELGSGTTNSSNTLVQCQAEDGNLENIIMIGRSSGDATSLNITAVREDGRIFTSGNNEYGQLGNNSYENSSYFVPMGYTIVDYPEEINVELNGGVQLDKDDLAYTEKYFNVYKEDILKETLLNNAEVFNTEIAVYTNGFVVGENLGSTMLIVKYTDKNVLINIPIRVLLENETVVGDVKNGDKFTVTLKADGTVWTFGNNTKGELGVGDYTARNVPAKVELLKDEKITEISVGTNHVIALTKDGEVYTWGLNDKGQLGNGTTKNSNIPIEINIPVNNNVLAIVKEKIIKVIANQNVSYALTQDGKVYVWGEGYSSSPKLLETDKNIIELGKTYYLADDGIVRKFGNNNEILLSYNENLAGDPTIIEEDKILQMSEGYDHLLMLGKSGKIYSYGQNVYGQLGEGTTVGRMNYISTAVRLNESEKLSDIIKVSAGKQYSIALSKTGKVYLFGKNEAGELGENPNVSAGGIQESSYAMLNNVLDNIANISAGTIHTTVSNKSGEVYTFGNGAYGELGNCENSDYYEKQLVGKNIIESNQNEVLMQIGEVANVKNYINYFNLYKEVETELTMEVLDTSMLLLDNASGDVIALKSGRTTIIVKEVSSNKIGVIQVRVLEEGTVPETNSVNIEPQVATGGSHTISLKVDGTVWAYGQNTYGQLGNGTTNYSDEPIKVTFPDGTVITKITAGEDHNLALDKDGNVWVWGRNQYYQLGNSKDSYSTIPTKITSITGIKDIESGTYTSYVVTNEGEVYSFGLNANGEGGIGSYTTKITINKVKYLTDIIDIKAGKNHAIALKSTGEIYVTGSNLYGELGNGDFNIRKQNTFTKIESLSGIVAIGTGSSNNIALDRNSNVYVWGSNIYGELGINSVVTSVAVPTKVQINNVRYLEGGKNTSSLIDSTGNVYVAGVNKLGTLGNNTNSDITKFVKLNTISDVIDISQGNSYTTYLKSDGTVYGSGDYNHGDTTLKAKTTGNYPIQVGNDETGFNENEILVKVDGTKDISANLAYAFNLIKLDDNYEESLSYESLNEKIAIVSEKGIVTGRRTGTTWIRAIDTTGKVYIVKVNVVEEKYAVSPKIEAGENFVAILKGDGSIYTIGYNGDGALADGTNITKDIPQATNVIATYKDISSGENFFVTLREDGTVWASGFNLYGQLGSSSTKNSNKLLQVNGLTGIVKIAAGKNHVIAIDDYGLLYGWGANSEGQLGVINIGENTLSPVAINSINERIIDISAGDDQTIVVTAKGTVFGMGNILNGYLTDIENAVKVEVGNGYLLILTKDGTIYEYNGTSLTQVSGVSNAIDISVKNNVNMYQSIDEKTYTWGENTYGQLGDNQTIDTVNPTLVNKHGENTYTIGAGYNNTYVIENTGFVYASGYNEYGSLGNSTRIDNLEHVLVGNREFEILPKTKIMTVNDKEEPEIKSDTFNVFATTSKLAEEYNWESNDIDVVYVADGKLTAYNEGTAIITVTDKVTGKSVQIERYVQEIDKQRIKVITVDGTEAEVSGYDELNNDIMTYRVNVETDNNEGVLVVKTNDSTDRISLDKEDWNTNVGTGTFATKINLQNKITEVPIYIKTTNGTILKYILTVEKVSKDVGIKKITLTSGADLTNPDEIVEARAVSLTKYEAVVSNDTVVTLGDVVTNSEYAYVSIDGKAYTLNSQNKNIVLGTAVTKEIGIVVKSESGIEQEYTVVIYKNSELVNLETVTVNEKEATKVSEGKYSITVANDVKLGNIYAKSISNLVEVSIENNTYKVLENTNTISLNNNPQEVSIKLKLPSGDIKEYILEVYKKVEETDEEKSLLDMVIVNGNVIMPNSEGKYEAYLPSSEIDAIVKAIAVDTTSIVQIETNTAELGESEVRVETLQNVNTYKIKVTPDEGEVKEYTLIIKKAEADTSMKEIYVENGTFRKQATKKDETTYEVRIPSSYTEMNVTAISQYVNSKVKIEEGEYSRNEVTEKIILLTENDTSQIKITIQSEDETIETVYTLNIIKMSDDTSLKSVKVDGIDATYDENTGEYTIQLTDAVSIVSIEAITTDENAKVKIDTNGYELNTTTRDVKIDAKTTISSITVQAEDGSTKTYKLNIEGLSDNTNIAKVTVNGIEATYREGENKYEVRLNDSKFNIEVTPEDILAKVKLGDETEVVGVATTSVSKSGDETIVKVKVTSQNGLEVEEYEIVIKDKSNDASIASIVVNGKSATKVAEGNYIASIKGNVDKAIIEVETTDSYAVVSLDGENQNKNNITVTKVITDRETIYTIKVVAEDGTEESSTLTITKLSNNVDILDLSVTTSEEVENEETGEITITDKVQNPILKEDGTYYLKIDRVDKAKVKVTLADGKSEVKIKNSNYVLLENEVIVDTVNDINTIIISVKAEDGTVKTYTLILEKMSNNTEIEIETDSAMKITDYTIYVDEVLNEIDLELSTISDVAKIRLVGETDYVLKTIRRKIELTDETKDTSEQAIENSWIVDVEVKAEDGTETIHTVTIVKTGNVDITSVKVAGEKIENNNDIFKTRINVTENTNIEIIASNENANIEIIKVSEDVETIVANGTGALTTNVDLLENPQEYVIRITSALGTSSKDYKLVIEQKSTETGISYVKVNELTAIETDSGYVSVVSGKETYPIIIKTIDENAEVKIAYDGYTGKYFKGKLTETIPVPDESSLEVTIAVKAENGNESTYNLTITRISSNTDIEKITVEDIVEVQKEDGSTSYEKQPIEVKIYNAKTKTYSIVVNKTLDLSKVVVNAKASLSKVALDSETETVGSASIEKDLKGLGATEVTIRVLAADGTEEIRYLNIIQLSDEIGLQQVTVDGTQVIPDEVNNYEITVTNEVDISNIYAKAVFEASKVSINNNTAKVLENTASISKGTSRQKSVPITVIAEDGTTYTYTLTINIISHNANTSYVKIEDENAEYINGEYKKYIDFDKEQVDIEIKAESGYARIEANGQSSIDKLCFTYDASDLEIKEFYIPYKIIAEDGTEIDYVIHLIRKSTANEIEKLYVDGELIEVSEDGKYYASVVDGSTKALVKVIANNEFAKVEFDELNKIQTLEKYININQDAKVTTILIKITSQQGTENTKTLILERISPDAKLKYVKVDNVDAEILNDSNNEYVSYIYDTTEQVTIDIGSNNEYAHVQQVAMNAAGEVIVIRDSINKLVFDITTNDEKTVVYFRIVAEDGKTLSPIYTLNVEKMSTDTTLKEIWVNGNLIEKNEEGKYVAKVLDTEGNPIVKAVTNHSLAHVRIVLGEECLAVAQKQVSLSTEKETIVPITVRSQSGITKVTYLYIEVISTSVQLDALTVDDKEPNVYDEKTHTYEFVVAPEKEEYELFTIAESNYANINYDTSDYGSSLRMKVQMAKDIEGKKITLKVSSESGLEQEYTILLIRESDDTSLEYLKVDGINRLPEQDGITYKVMIGKLQKQATIEVKTTYQYASIRLADFDVIRNSEKGVVDCNLDQDWIIVPIIVTAPDGQTVKTYNVILIRGSNDTSIELKVNDIVINESEDGNYKANILDTDTTVKIEGTILATSVMGGEAGKIDINATGTYETPNKTVNLVESDISGKRTIVVPIVVIAEDGTTKENILVITVLSTDDTMSSLEVRESVEDTIITRVPTLNTESNMYETQIKYQTTNVDVEVTSTNSNATILYVDSYGNAITDSSGTPITAKGNLTVNVQTPTETTVVYYKITSESGTESTIYTLRIDKMSNNTMLQKVEVNEEEATKDIDGNYSIIVKGSTDTGNVVVTKDSSIQKVRINGEETTEKAIPLDDIVTEVTIEVEAEDGSKKISTLKIIKSTTISGKITTENFEGKHKSNISIYNKDDLENPVVTGITEDDGSFELDLYITGITAEEDIDGNGIVDVLENEYTVIVSKPGYLSYTVTKVTLTEGLNSDIGEYALIGGDTVETGEIEIDDLVALNDNFGVIITEENKSKKSIYDLDEDGIITIADRNILKANYGKQAEEVEWVNPYAIMTLSLSPELEENVEKENFILPIACEYIITDNYGYRIHPTTGEESKHTGIDLAGEWHTEILAVQSGEVVFAGVQTAFGNCIEIKHEVNGEIIYSFYAHLSEIRVEVGDTVEQGEVIGLEGGDSVYDENPGYSTGHHLHFEIRKASGYGNDIDPYDYINL